MNAKTLAKYIIKHSYDHGDAITNLKLQKLLYYCYAWYMAITNKKLFNDQIQAWVHGPVIPSVYSEYKKFAYLPIEPCLEKIKLESDHESVVNDVLGAYSGFSAYQLELMSHYESPWINARKGLKETQNSSRIISDEDIYTYFSGRLGEKK